MTRLITTDDSSRGAWRVLRAAGQRLAPEAVAADLLAASRTTIRTGLQGRAA